MKIRPKHVRHDSSKCREHGRHQFRRSELLELAQALARRHYGPTANVELINTPNDGRQMHVRTLDCGPDGVFSMIRTTVLTSGEEESIHDAAICLIDRLRARSDSDAFPRPGRHVIEHKRRSAMWPGMHARRTGCLDIDVLAMI